MASRRNNIIKSSNDALPKGSSSDSFTSAEEQNPDTDSLIKAALALVETTNKDLTRVNSEIGKIQDSLKNKEKIIQKKTVLQEKRIADLENKIDERQVKSIEALGIFVALFSYISITIQIFSRITSAWSAGLFALLLLCALVILVIVLDLLLARTPRSLKDLFFDFRIYLIFVFFMIAFLSICSLRNIPLNPVPDSINFENTVNKHIDDRIEALISEKTYSRMEVDSATSSLQSFKNCLRIQGTFWPCIK